MLYSSRAMLNPVLTVSLPSLAAGDSEANVDRRERLRKLAMETIDLAKVRQQTISMSGVLS